VFLTDMPIINPIAAPISVRSTSKFAFTICKHFALVTAILNLKESSRVVLLPVFVYTLAVVSTHFKLYKIVPLNGR
jgi:hypothetical protein